MAGNGERLRIATRPPRQRAARLGHDLGAVGQVRRRRAGRRSASAVLAKYNRLQRLLAESADEDKKAETFAEAAALAREVMPI